MNFTVSRPLPGHEPATVKQEWKFVFFERNIGSFTLKLDTYCVLVRKSAHHAAKWEYPGYGNPAWNTLRDLPRIALDRRNSVAPELVPLPDDVISEVKAALLEAVKQIQVEKPS